MQLKTFNARKVLVWCGMVAIVAAQLVACEDSRSASSTAPSGGTSSGQVKLAAASRASLPADWAKHPAASSCDALRSGTYRMVTPKLGGTLAEQTGTAVLNAETLSIKRPDGSTGSWTANGNCRFTDPGSRVGGIDYVVSQAGVLVGRMRVDGGGSYRNVIGFPEQVHQPAELAGTWNGIGQAGSSNGLHVDAGNATIDNTGALKGATVCNNPGTWAVDVCNELPPEAFRTSTPFHVSKTGGFSMPNTEEDSRLFMYQPGAGAPMLVSISAGGAFSVATLAQAMPLPEVGLKQTLWNFDMSNQLVSPNKVYETSNTITGTDTAGNTWKRTKETVGRKDAHTETLNANTPRAGYYFRPEGSAQTGSGEKIMVKEYTALHMPSVGITPLVLRTLKLFELSVAQP